MRKFDSDVPKFPCWQTDDGTCYNHLCQFETCRYYGTNDSCLEAPQFCPAFQNCSTCLNGDCPNKDRCDTFNREEESDSFPVGYPGGDLEEWQRQFDGAFADQNF